MTPRPVINQRLRIIVHLTVWMILFILPAYLLPGKTPHDKGFVREVWSQIAFYCILFYISYLYLIPKFFSRDRKVLWFMFIIVLTGLMTYAMGLIRDRLNETYREPGPPMRPPELPAYRQGAQGNIHPPFPGRRPGPGRTWPYFNFILTASLVSGLSLGLRFSEKMTAQEKMVKEAEKQRLDQELALLRYQINPHFMFNTLNTIYSLALMKSDHTPDAVMKLSEMMRYVLQDVQREKVPLDLEFSYIRDYVELQKLRLSGNVIIDLDLPAETCGLEIAPVLLVPYIENTFKHGISTHEDTLITIRILLIEKQLHLYTENRIFREKPATEITGIGLANTKKRLDLIYPDNYTLEMDQRDGRYKVSLTINLA